LFNNQKFKFLNYFKFKNYSKYMIDKIKKATYKIFIENSI